MQPVHGRRGSHDRFRVRTGAHADRANLSPQMRRAFDVIALFLGRENRLDQEIGSLLCVGSDLASMPIATRGLAFRLAKSASPDLISVKILIAGLSGNQ